MPKLAAAEALLRRGWSEYAVARSLKMRARTVIKLRIALGLPAPQPLDPIDPLHL